MMDITIQEIKSNWEKQKNPTPAGGTVYHDNDDDRVAITYRYHTNVYFNRREGYEKREKLACLYADSIRLTES